MPREREIKERVFKRKRVPTQQELALLDTKNQELIISVVLFFVFSFLYLLSDSDSSINIYGWSLRSVVIVADVIVALLFLLLPFVFPDIFNKKSSFRNGGFYVGNINIFYFKDVKYCFPVLLSNDLDPTIFDVVIVFKLKRKSRGLSPLARGGYFFEKGFNWGEDSLKVRIPREIKSRKHSDISVLAAYDFLKDRCPLKTERWDDGIAHYMQVFRSSVRVRHKGVMVEFFNAPVSWNELLQAYPVFPDSKDPTDKSLPPEGVLMGFGEGFYSDFLVQFPMVEDSIKAVGGYYDGTTLFIPVYKITGGLRDWLTHLPPRLLAHQNWARFQRYLEADRMKGIGC